MAREEADRDTSRDRVIVGSADTCDIVIESPVVSRRHCAVRRQPQGFLIEDLNSRNGLFVDGVRIDAKTVVAAHATVTLGKSVPLPWGELLGFFEDRAGAAHRRPKLLTIGRGPGNDLVLDDPTVSNRHARVIYEQGNIFVEDLGSRNGTYRVGEDAPLARALLRPGDVIRVGNTEVPAKVFFGGEVADRPVTQKRKPDRHETVLDDGPAISHGVLDLNGRQGEFLLGRDPGCAFRLNYPMVSLRHAKLTLAHRQAVITDLGSSNGTYVNGVRITRPTTVRPGDVIALGSVWFEVSDDGLHLDPKSRRGDIAIQAKGLGVTVADGTRILEKVDLVILPGELVGLMGPSGAGKSTLIATLNGYLSPSSGTVTINGRDLYKNYDEFRGMIGYVPQDDIMHADLTVAEALYFSARLRLPTDYSDEEIEIRVRKVMAELGLQGTENTRIGNAERRGISGGQRKRVNVAMELLTDPPLLFLDEPTSGLSSEDALSLMQLLRQLSDGGKTVVLTIHQPSLESYRLMDNLIVVGKDKSTAQAGRLAYYGRAYPDGIRFFDGTGSGDTLSSPDAVLRGLGSQPIRDWVGRYEKSDYYKKFVAHRLRHQKEQPHKHLRKRRTAGGGSQYVTLVRRGLAVKLKDIWNTGVLVLQAPLIALLIGLVFGPKIAGQVTLTNYAGVATATATTMYLLGISALWFGSSNSAREIVAEAAIYRRERMVGLGIPSYIASKVTILAMLCLFQCGVLLLVVGCLGKLAASWLALYGAIVMASLVGVAIGLAVSAVARTSEVAAGILPLVILPMVILGGMLLPLHELPRFPIPMRVLAATMPSRWAFESLLLPEACSRIGLDTKAEPPRLAKLSDSSKSSDSRPTDMAEGFFPYADRWPKATGFPSFVLAVQATMLLAVVGAFLSARDRS